MTKTDNSQTKLTEAVPSAPVNENQPPAVPTDPTAAEPAVPVPVSAEHEGTLRLLDSGVECRVVEYAPNRFCALLPPGEVPRYGVVRLQRLAQNKWRPVLLGWSKLVGISRWRKKGAQGGEAGPPPADEGPENAQGETGLAAHLGLDLSYNSILRLYKNGFIRGSMPTPSRILIDLQSLYDHIEETKDPDYWTKERRAQYWWDIY